MRNTRRAPLRVGMTVAAVAVSLVAFVVLRTVGEGWTQQIEQTPDDRVVSRHKMGWGRALPMHYAQQIREMPGVRQAVGARWAELKLDGRPLVALEGLAVEQEPFVAMHHELEAPSDQKQTFLETRNGAFVSRVLADELGWHVGDRVNFIGSRFDGLLEATIAGIFTSTRHGFATRTVYLRWDYFDERVRPSERGIFNLVASQLEDPTSGANVAKAIDTKFGAYDQQTFSLEDQAVHAQLVGGFAAIMDSMDLLSLLTLGIVMLIIGNTMAMNVRERTKEYGALRALGFMPSHVMWFVIGEAAVLGLAGGAVCVALAYPLVEGGVSRFVEESAGVAPLQISPLTAGIALLLGALLGIAASTGPAFQSSRVSVVEALRRVA